MKRTIFATVTAVNATGEATLETSCSEPIAIRAFSNSELACLASTFNNKNDVRITVEIAETRVGFEFDPAYFDKVKARLDADGTAKPLTRIVHHPPKDARVGPGIPLHAPEHEDEHGKRTPLDHDSHLLHLQNVDVGIGADTLYDKATRDAMSRANMSICDICGRPSTDTDVISDEADAPCACEPCRVLFNAVAQARRALEGRKLTITSAELTEAWQAFIKRPR
jgi:hypothetical protein